MVSVSFGQDKSSKKICHLSATLSIMKIFKQSRFNSTLSKNDHNNKDFSFLLKNNIHHFDLISLPGLTLPTETNDIPENLKKIIRVKASRPLVEGYSNLDPSVYAAFPSRRDSLHATKL